MIEVADDGEIALGAVGKAQVVAAGADVLAADDERSGLGSLIAVVAEKRQIVTLVDVDITNVGKSANEQLAALEDDLGIGEILRQDPGLPFLKLEEALAGGGLASHSVYGQVLLGPAAQLGDVLALHLGGRADGAHAA